MAPPDGIADMGVGGVGLGNGESMWQPPLRQRDLLEVLLDFFQRRYHSSKLFPYFARASVLLLSKLQRRTRRIQKGH